MNRVLIFLLILKILYSVFCQNKRCLDCCDTTVNIYGAVELCEETKWCSSSFWTDEEENRNYSDLRGTVYENATYVNLLSSSASSSLRRCTLQNFNKINTIYGDNIGLMVLEVKAFWNLTSLRKVYLAFNMIKEVQYGIFSFTTIEMLDLSWNKIKYIGDYAFRGMENLTTLNLSYNELTTLELIRYWIPLKQLYVSHNFLATIRYNYKFDLSVIDLSFNKLQYFELYYKKSIDTLDLTNNDLSWFPVRELNISNLIISSNTLTDVDPLMNDKMLIKTITIYPNIWNCEKLVGLLSNLQQRNITIVKPEVDKRFNFDQLAYPVCALNSTKAHEEYRRIKKAFIRKQFTFCRNDNQCPSFMICRNQQCWEPCKYNACRTNGQLCETRNHKFLCKCPKEQLKNPYVLFSNCRKPCYTEANCPKGYYCNQDPLSSVTNGFLSFAFCEQI